MSTDTEARKAAVERAIKEVEKTFCGHMMNCLSASELRHLVAAAKAGIAGDGEEVVKAPRCIFCEGECKVAGGRDGRYVLCNGCLAEGPTKPTEAEAISAFIRPQHLPGASKPEPPPSEVAIVRGAISIVADRAGKAWVSASIPECESPAFSKLATADQLDALAALASRVAAEMRAKGGAA